MRSGIPGSSFFPSSEPAIPIPQKNIPNYCMSRLDQMLELLSEDPNDSFTRYAVALEYLSNKEHGKALEYLEELRKRDPAYLATYYQLGQTYSVLDEWNKAEEVYVAGIEIGRKVGDLHTVSELQAALDELESLRE